MTKRARKRRATAYEMVQMRQRCHELLLSDLHKPEIQAGSPIEGERTLSKRYDIPLSVIRATLAELKNDGVIETVPRTGMCLVAPPPPPQTLKDMKFAFVAYMDQTKPEHVLNNSSVICSGMEDLMNAQGGEMHFFNTWQAPGGIPGIAKEIKNENYNAIAFVPDVSQTAEETKYLTDTGIPTVTIDRKNPYCPNISFDDENIGRTVASYILDLGHRDVAVMHFPEQQWSQNRVESLKKEFTERGTKAPDVFDFKYPQDQDEIEKFAKEKCPNYTAVIVANDATANYLLDYTKLYGIRVPEDLSVIEVDDFPTLRYLNLTTVQLSPMASGEKLLSY